MSRTSLMEIISTVKQGNIPILMVLAFLMGLATIIYETVNQPFILAIIPSLVVVGTLQAIYRFGMSFFQIFGGFISDRSGGKLAFSLAFLFVALMGINFILIVILPLDDFLALTGIIIGSLVLSAGIAFTALLVPAAAIESSEKGNNSKQARRTGLFLGILLSVEFSSGIIGPVIAGYSVDLAGYPLIFAVMFFIGLTGIILALLFFRNSTVINNPLKSRKSIRSSLHIKKSLRAFYLASFIDSFGWFLILGIWFSLLITFHDYTIGDIAFLNVVFSLFLGIAQIPAGWLVDHFKKNHILIISNLLSLMALIIWMYSQDLWWISFGYIFLAFDVATWIPTNQAYIGEMVPEQERAFEIGKWSSYRGIFILLAPIIGGLLAENYGFHAPMLVTLVIAGSAVFFYWRIE